MSRATPPPKSDTIYLRNLSLTTSIAPGDAWSRAAKPTPVSLTIKLHLPPHSLSAPAAGDDVTQTISYGTIAKHVLAAVASSPDPFASLPAFAAFVRAAVLTVSGGRGTVSITAHLRAAALLADAIGIDSDADADSEPDPTLVVRGVRATCVIGVHAHERRERQRVVIGLRARGCALAVWEGGYQDVVRRVADLVAGSEFLTVERLAVEVAAVVCSAGVREVTVAVEKPSAVVEAEASGVEITRWAADFD